MSDMSHEAYERAASFWERKDAEGEKLDKAALEDEVRKFLKENNTCALATGYGDFVRCTPIEYTYIEGEHGDFGHIYMFSEGGQKFRALEHNKNVCLAIFSSYKGFGNLKGMQVSGTAAIVEPFSEEYTGVAAAKAIPLPALQRLPDPMNLIRVTPGVIEFLNSDFAKKKAASRQRLEL